MICNKYFDLLKNLPIYDETTKFNSHHERRVVWEYVREANLSTESEAKNFSTQLAAILKGIPLKGSANSEFVEVASLESTLTEERLDDYTNYVFSSAAEKKINREILNGITTCLSTAMRGLNVQAILTEDWRTFRLRVAYLPDVHKGPLKFDFRASDDFRLIEYPDVDGDGNHQIQPGHISEDWVFERTSSKPGQIFLTAKDGASFPRPVAVTIPWAFKSIETFIGEVEMQTNYFAGARHAEHRVKQYNYEFKKDTSKQEAGFDDNHWNYVNYAMTDEGPEISLNLRLKHGNPVDGNVQVPVGDTKTRELNKYTTAQTGEHWGWSKARMKTRYLLVDALKFEDSNFLDSLKSMTVGDRTIYLPTVPQILEINSERDGEKTRELELRSSDN